VGVGSADRYWPIALDRTRYVGEPVALVVATDRYLAEDAAERVFVDYEPEAAVMDLEAAPAVSRRSFRHGEPERAFEVAAHRVSGTFRFPRYSSTPIECYAAIADWDAPGDEATIWSNFHGPFVMQPLVAACLGLPENRLRLLVPADIGGSFGIKSGLYAYMQGPGRYLSGPPSAHSVPVAALRAARPDPPAGMPLTLGVRGMPSSAGNAASAGARWTRSPLSTGPSQPGAAHARERSRGRRSP
jgi:hypothetical protein